MIRVLLERQLAEGMELTFWETARSIRQLAVTFPGYISGETLRDPDNTHHVVVISTWQTRRDWDRWMASDERKKLHAKLDPLLEAPERVTVLEPF